jgi:transcriptional regulator with XRE-family HTH domain
MGLLVKRSTTSFNLEWILAMGQASRPKPKRLARKLRTIREGLGLSQNQLIDFLGLRNELTQARISAYERGIREPPAIVLLRYARRCLGSGAHLENLIDDKLDLPKAIIKQPKETTNS